MRKKLFLKSTKELGNKISLLLHPDGRKRLLTLLDFSKKIESFSVLGLIEEQLQTRDQAIAYASLLYEADGFLPQDTPINNPSG